MNVIVLLGEREITKPTRINLFSLEYISTSASEIYEGCQKSSWTHMIEASNEPEFDIYYYISLK